MFDKEAIVLEYVKYADHIAWRQWQTAPYALDLDTLKSDGYVGLVEAANRWLEYCDKKGYDPAAVQYFKAYAGKRIYGAIRDGIRAKDWATRTVRAKSRLLKDNGLLDGASISDIAKNTSLKEKDVRRTIVRMLNKPVPLEAASNYSSASTNTDSRIFADLILAGFAEVISTRPKIEQTILVLMHFTDCTLDQVAEELRLSKVSVKMFYDNILVSVIHSLRAIAGE